MIFDHDKSKAAGELVEMTGRNDETMVLHVVTAEEAAGPAPSVDYPVLEKKMRWAGPFPVRPVRTLGGRLSIKKPRMQDVPRDDKPEGVVRPRPKVRDTSAFLAETDDHEDTGTFALPAVWKMTGKPSANKLAHRSAAHIQKVFNEAGWPIAVWYGEATEKFWVMDDRGLHEFATVTGMYQGMGWSDMPGEGVFQL